MSERPLTLWVVCENSGKVLSAYCDCMAGLGESCSHVALLLWTIEVGCKRRDSLTVTDKKAYWVLPTSVKTVPYARVKDINFSKTPCSISTVKPSSVTPPSETELTTSIASMTALLNLHYCPVLSLLIQILMYLNQRPCTLLSAKSGVEANIPEFNVLTRFVSVRTFVLQCTI